MDSSHKFGVAEECNSSESGWTMYIGSPINGGTDDDDGGGGDDHESNNSDDGGGDHYLKAEDESDDSMASDASSGPSHRGRPSWEENRVDKNGGKNCSEKKAKNINPVEKSGSGRKKEEKKEEGSAFNSKAGEKVRKSSSWFGKRK